MTTYEAHELASVFPPMSEPEFAAFKEDIREQGQQESIILYEGKILDGLHRYRACRELGREPRLIRFEGNPRAAAQLVLGRNFHRRHLTTSQRALIAAEMCKLRPRGNAGTSPYSTAAQASTLMGVGQDLVKDAKHLLRSGDQDLLRSVRDGVQSVSAAVQEKKKKKKAGFTFLEQFAQRLDRALQGHNDRDAQVIYGAKPLLQYITLRLQDYLDPRTAEPRERGGRLRPVGSGRAQGPGLALHRTRRGDRGGAARPARRRPAEGEASRPGIPRGALPGMRAAAAIDRADHRSLLLRRLQGQRALGMVVDA